MLIEATICISLVVVIWALLQCIVPTTNEKEYGKPVQNPNENENENKKEKGDENQEENVGQPINDKQNPARIASVVLHKQKRRTRRDD